MDQKVGFFRASYTIVAGGQVDIPFLGDALTILSATGTVDVGIDGGPRTAWPVGVGYKLPPGQEFGLVTLENGNGGAITVDIVLALGDIRDQRLTVTGAIDISKSTANLSNGTTSLGAGNSQIWAGSATARRIFVSNLNPTVTVMVGLGGGGPGGGIPLPPGERVEFETTLVVFVYNPSAGAVNVAFLVTGD